MVRYVMTWTRAGRRDAPGLERVLKDRRSPRRRGRTGTSVMDEDAPAHSTAAQTPHWSVAAMRGPKPRSEPATAGAAAAAARGRTVNARCGRRRRRRRRSSATIAMGRDDGWPRWEETDSIEDVDATIGQGSVRLAGPGARARASRDAFFASPPRAKTLARNDALGSGFASIVMGDGRRSRRRMNGPFEKVQPSVGDLSDWKCAFPRE